MKALSESLRERITALCPDWNLQYLSGFLYLEGGYSNHNYRFDYRGDRYVLRVPFRDRPWVDRVLERQVYVAAAPMCAPLVALDAASGDMITRWVPGALLADHASEPAALADYLSDLHAALPAPVRDYDPIAHAAGHLAQSSAPAWLLELAAGLRWRPAASITCHNDLNPWNVIRTAAGGWVTLDWEWVGQNDPLFDLATLHQGSGLDAGALPFMAERYLGRPAEPERLHACLVALWLRETAWAMAEAAAGNDRPEVLAQRDSGVGRLRELTGRGPPLQPSSH